jgi:hypothetical protein
VPGLPSPPVSMGRKPFLLIPIAIIILWSILPCCHILQIRAPRKGKIVFVARIEPNDRFATKYIHSVELCPIWEFFRIDEEYRIVLYETTFCSSNVGLPYAAFGQEEFHVEKDKFRISNMHRVLPMLALWVNEKYDNTFEFKDRRLRLPSLVGNTLVNIAIKEVSPVRFVYLLLRSDIRAL